MASTTDASVMRVPCKLTTTVRVVRLGADGSPLADEEAETGALSLERVLDLFPRLVESLETLQRASLCAAQHADSGRLVPVAAPSHQSSEERKRSRSADAATSSRPTKMRRNGAATQQPIMIDGDGDDCDVVATTTTAASATTATPTTTTDTTAASSPA